MTVFAFRDYVKLDYERCERNEFVRLGLHHEFMTFYVLVISLSMCSYLIVVVFISLLSPITRQMRMCSSFLFLNVYEPVFSVTLD